MNSQNNLLRRIDEAGIQNIAQKMFIRKMGSSTELINLGKNMQSKGWKTWIYQNTLPANEFLGTPSRQIIDQIVIAPSGRHYSEKEILHYLDTRKPEFGNEKDIEINQAGALLTIAKLYSPHIYNPRKHSSALRDY